MTELSDLTQQYFKKHKIKDKEELEKMTYHKLKDLGFSERAIKEIENYLKNER